MIKDIFEKIWDVICFIFGGIALILCCICILTVVCLTASAVLTHFLANPIHIAYAFGGLALFVALIWLSVHEAFLEFIASFVLHFLLTILAFVFIVFVGFINGFFPGPIH